MKSLSILLFVLFALVACLLTPASASTAPRRHHRVPAESNSTAPSVRYCRFNGQGGRCIPSESCSDGTVIPGLCDEGAADGTHCCIRQPFTQPGCGSAAVHRALEWVNVQLHYCQAPNGQSDPDADCPHICSRYSNHAYDPYRSDCSGLVSYAYGLPAPGRDTNNFAPYQTDISRVLESPMHLRHGDAINSDPHEHIMIFVEWLSEDRTRMRLLEEPGCSSSTPYARVTDSDVTVNQNGTLFVVENGMTFWPIRFLTSDPPC